MQSDLKAPSSFSEHAAFGQNLISTYSYINMGINI
jgi:hypothetical protein